MTGMKTPSGSDGGALAQNDATQHHAEETTVPTSSHHRLRTVRLDETSSSEDTPAASREVAVAPEPLLDSSPGMGFDASQTASQNTSMPVPAEYLVPGDRRMSDLEVEDMEIGGGMKPKAVDPPQEQAVARTAAHGVVPHHHLARTGSRTLRETGTTAFVVIRENGLVEFFSRNNDLQPSQGSAVGEVPEYQHASRQETLEIVEEVNREESEVIDRIAEQLNRDNERRTLRRGLGFGFFIGLSIGLISLSVVLLLNRAGVSEGEEDIAGEDDSIADSTNGTLKSTIEEIKVAGKLRCGVSGQRGHAFRDPATGRWEGFEVDLCRAMAAGILFGQDGFVFSEDSEEPVQFVQLDPIERFQALHNKTIDVLLAATTHTMERHIYENTTKTGYSFSTPYLHDGLLFAGQPDAVSCIESLGTNSTQQDCNDVKICVFDGSTHKTIIDDLIKAYSLPQDSRYLAPNVDAFYDNFVNGFCNVLAGESLDVAEMNVRQRNYDGAYKVGSRHFSNEPLAIVTRTDDPRFSDYVNWILQGLFAAEGEKLGKFSGEDKILSAFKEFDFFGPGLESMFVDSIVTVGNFGEIYENNLEPIVPRADVNQINTEQTPLMYPYPMDNLRGSERTAPLAGGTLETIKNRGKLRCGVFKAAIFSELDEFQTRSGIDVSFCQALAAAIFGGEYDNRIDYRQVPSPGDRFEMLANGDIDVLSRITTITMLRDVQEPSTGIGFSFGLPYYHDEMHFAGIPTYARCANNLDVSSEECKGLNICAVRGTTTIGIVEKLFHSDFIEESSTSPDMFEKFKSGQCNAIVGGYARVSEANIRSQGYDGDYEIGERAFSQEPMALVTREDDPEWSAFCFWIVSAILYAEDKNITQATSQDMPTVDLFGPSYQTMFRDTILAVGNYAEISDRSAGQNGLPRAGRNLLNKIPRQPQLYTPFFLRKAQH